MTATAALALLLLVSLVTRLWLGRRVPTPWILVDEFIYSEYAKSFAAHHDLLVRGQPSQPLGHVYPALISPAWHFDEMNQVYAWAKGINVGLMSLGVIPVYLWARRMVSPLNALVAATLTLALPAFIYTNTLMTENAFFPAFLLALYATARVLEKPTLLWQGAMLLAFALAIAIRVQALVLLPILATALVLKLLLDHQTRAKSTSSLIAAALRALAPTILLVAITGVTFIIMKEAEGVPLRAALGAYSVAGSDVYSARDALRWVVYHFAELGLLVGVIPASAFIVVSGLAWKANSRFTDAERAFVATAAASVVWFVIEVGIFASRFSIRIEERNMFAVAPLLLLGLAVWLNRGLPRPPAITAVAVSLPAALIVTLPLESLLNISILSDTFGLVPFWRLSERLAGGVNDVRIVLAAGVVGAGIAFASFPQRIARPLTIVAVAAFLIGSSYSVFGRVSGFSQAVKTFTGASDPSWIDKAVVRNQKVAYLFGSQPDPSAEAKILWETEFWNRTLTGVYYLSQSENPSLPHESASLDATTGRIVTGDGKFPRYVVAPSGLSLAGRRVAVTPTLALYRVRRPLRLSQTIEGVYADGWTGSDAALTRYVPGGKHIRVTVSRASWRGQDTPAVVRILIGPAVFGSDGAPQLTRANAARSWTIHSGLTRRFTLPTPPPPYRVEIHVEPTFSPSQFGSPDTRQLGAQVQFHEGAP